MEKDHRIGIIRDRQNRYVMVAKISIGKDFGRLLGYNEQKVEKGDAVQLEAAGFLNETASFAEKLALFKWYTDKNHISKSTALHITLNFDNADQLDTDRLRQIASTYMEKIGFGEQPYLLYEHNDAGHKHVHLVTTNIQANGKRIPTEFIGRERSEPARKEIELLFGLVQADSKKLKEQYQIKPVDLAAAEYGKMETKNAISNVVRQVVKSYKFASLAELNAALLCFNVTADRGDPDSRLFQKGGLNYSIIDKDGCKVGKPIKASSIYGRPILKNLETKYAQNKADRYGSGLRLQKIVDKIIDQPGVLTRQMMADQLKEQNIQVIYRINEQGRLYGITYVDHAAKAVFNGSALGKAYSANAISERLFSAEKQPNNKQAFKNPTLGNTSQTNSKTEHDLPYEEGGRRPTDRTIRLDLNSLLDALTSETPYEEDIDFHFRKRKKR